MKKLPFVIVPLLLTQICIAQAKKNSLSKEHLKGKVKRIEMRSFDGDPADGKIDTLGPHSTFIELYDENGNATEISYFGKDGVWSSKTIKKYNEKNQDTEEDDFTKGILASTTFFKYDDRGTLIESVREDITYKTSVKTLYKYDDRGNDIENDMFNSGGSLNNKSTYKYDDKGNQIESDAWSIKADTIGAKWTFAYNNEGDQVQQSSYAPNGDYRSENTFTFENFDRLGNWQRQTEASENTSKLWHSTQFVKHSSYTVTKRKIYYY
jgi:hypothetical protein